MAFPTRPPSKSLPAGFIAFKQTLGCRLQGLDSCQSFYIGSVKSILFCSKADLGRPFIDAAGQVIAFENNTATKWISLSERNLTGSLTTTWNPNEFGANYESSLGFSIGKKSPVNRNTLLAFVRKDVAAIVFDMNGGAWLVGWDFGFRNAVVTDQTGTSRTDLNGYSLTFKTTNRQPPRQVTVDAVDALVLDYSQNCNQPFAQSIPLLSLQDCELNAYNSIPL